MPDASGTTVTVNENTELHRILCIFDAENLRNVGPGCALKYPIEVFRNTMTAMKTVTDLLASLVTSPDAMKITLNYVKVFSSFYDFCSLTRVFFCSPQT